MKKIIIVISLTIPLLAVRCVKKKDLANMPTIYNNFNYKIYYNIKFSNKDTLMYGSKSNFESNKAVLSIDANSTNKYNMTLCDEKTFKSIVLLTDTIQLTVFNYDTVSKYDWSEIQRRNLYVKRFRLTYSMIKSNDCKIVLQ
jgi:hypothetical protein